MVKKTLQKILGDPNQKALKKINPLVERVNTLGPEYKKLSDDELRSKTAEFKDRLKKGETLDDVQAEAFATVREVAERVLKQRHFDVQIIGGAVLHQGNIAEMRTGEGKTLVATLPVYLNALSGKGVHVVTVNDYLAQRDAGWMAEIYDFLGLSTAVIVGQQQSFIFDRDYLNEDHDDIRLQHLKPVSRREAYRADVTYGTNNEFGFDYLRDNMVQSEEQMTQRELNYAIVDEVDSILIDEARTPLIISSSSSDAADMYGRFAQIARRLNPDDYEIDEKGRSASFTDDGIAKLEKMLKIDNLYGSDQIQTIYHLDQALRAQTLFKKDKDYVVRDGEVIIIDEFTGRMMHGRRYSEGLHQAIEAKEGVAVQQESVTLATISFQNLFRLYDKLSGMTGTAETEAEEFHTIYDLDVVIIPTNVPIARKDSQDRIYKTEAGKLRAIAADVKERVEKGQPVLLGTVSIEKNELLSGVLKDHGIKHEVLNAKNNEEEASIVARAGERGAVTLATNIAGRGTDIVLGEGVEELGGLHVLGSERHESRRIDNQLRGRTGRQGRPGSSQFYVSLEDDLMRIFAGDRVAGLMNTLGIDEDTPIENKLITRTLESAQKRVESHNFDIRKNVVQYDDVMNRHRTSVYERRKRIMRIKNVKEDILKMFDEDLATIVREHKDSRSGIVRNSEALKVMKTIVPLETKDIKKLEDSSDLAHDVYEYVEKIYSAREKEFGVDAMADIAKRVYLQKLDTLWMQHLENMDHLRQGIGLRSIGQRDPLTEYKNEGFRMYNELLAAINAEVVGTIFKVAPVKHLEELETELTKAAQRARLIGSQQSSQKSTSSKSNNSSEVDTTGMNREQRRRAERAAKKQKG